MPATQPKAASFVYDSEAIRLASGKNWKVFMALPEVENSLIDPATVKGSQLKRPLFEFSGACATGSRN